MGLQTAKLLQEGCSLQEHATEVQRLVGLAFVKLPGDCRHRMMLDIFYTSLSNASLQRHLLAAETTTLDSAVGTGHAFLPDTKPSREGLDPCQTGRRVSRAVAPRCRHCCINDTSSLNCLLATVN